MKFNLADVFETVADSVPERIALSYQGRQISYAELDTLSNQVAHLFAGAGIVEGSRPEAELAETTAKFRTLLSAIGLSA
mgnify:CR=1 FL=1